MRHALLFFIALLLSFPTVAAANPDADDANESGFEAFERGEYENAAGHFARAYALEPDPVFRKSEAVAWFKAQRCEEAIRVANAFLLEWTGDDKSRTEAQSVVANCKVSLAEKAIGAESFELAERLLFEATATAQDEYTRDRISATRVQLADARKALVERRDSGSDPQGGGERSGADVADTATPVPKRAPLRPLGIALVSTGGAAIVTAAVWHAVTLTKTVPRLQTEADGGDRELHSQLGNRVDTARIGVPVLYAAGAATLGLGTWFWIGPPDTEHPQASRRLDVGLSFSARF